MFLSRIASHVHAVTLRQHGANRLDRKILDRKMERLVGKRRSRITEFPLPGFSVPLWFKFWIFLLLIAGHTRAAASLPHK